MILLAKEEGRDTRRVNTTVTARSLLPAVGRTIAGMPTKAPDIRGRATPRRASVPQGVARVRSVVVVEAEDWSPL